MNIDAAYSMHKEVEKLIERARKLGLKVLWNVYVDGAAVKTKDGFEHRKLATLGELTAFLDGVEFHRDLHSARIERGGTAPDCTHCPHQEWYDNGQPMPRPKDEWGD